MNVPPIGSFIPRAAVRSRLLDAGFTRPVACARDMKYRLVMFDSDGTLADTLPWMRSVFNQVAEKHGLQRISEEQQNEFRDLHGKELLRALNLPLWKVPRLVLEVRRTMAAHVDGLSLFPGIGEALRKLSASGIALGIVSSNSTENVRRILGPKNAALITHFACDASMFGKAPKLRAVVRASGVAAAHALYVGDEIRDAEAARKAGVGFGAVSWGQHSLTALRTRNPAEIFESVEQMARVLSG